MKYLLRYWPDLRPHQGLLWAGIAAGVVAAAASGFGAPGSLQIVFAQLFETREEGHSLLRVLLTAAVLPGIFLLRGIASYANQYWMTQCGLEVLRSLRQRVFDHLQRLPLAFFERQRTGDLISRLLGDVQQIQQTILVVARDGLVQPLTALAGLTYLAYLSYLESDVIFLLLLLAITPLIILPVRLIAKHLKHRGRQVQHALGDTTHALQENLRGVLEVRAFNLEERQSRRFGDLLQRHFTAFMKMTKYEKLTQPTMELIAVTVVAAAFVYAYYHGLTFAVFLPMGVALYFTGDAVKKSLRVYNETQKTQGAAERLEEILSAPRAHEVAEESSDHFAHEWPERVEGRIIFDRVSFAYETGHTLFTGLSCTIAPGTFVALVGPSGAGKSTFVKLLARFHEPTAGAILVDRVPISQISARQLRDQIAFVPQAPVLFDATVAENIALARPTATRAEIEAAARAAYAHDFIAALPQGYDASVGEDAVRLSGGQRQRLALARAFLKDAPILILDEATSALDSESERRIQKALAHYAVGRTVLVIAHRFSTIRHADRVLLFDQGQLAADGPFEAVLEHPIFRQLHENQQLGAV
ncbi:MAG: ABC transporter ATP-binding protein [Verrucomicrobiota bacterium]